MRRVPVNHGKTSRTSPRTVPEGGARSAKSVGLSANSPGTGGFCGISRGLFPCRPGPSEHRHTVGSLKKGWETPHRERPEGGLGIRQSRDPGTSSFSGLLSGFLAIYVWFSSVSLNGDVRPSDAKIASCVRSETRYHLARKPLRASAECSPPRTQYAASGTQHPALGTALSIPQPERE